MAELSIYEYNAEKQVTCVPNFTSSDGDLLLEICEAENDCILATVHLNAVELLRLHRESLSLINGIRQSITESLPSN